MDSCNLKNIESRLHDIPCPICAEHSFQVDLRANKSSDIHTFYCRKCRYSFPVYIDAALYLESQPDMLEWFKSVTCQECKKQGVILNYRVQASVKNSYHLVTCAHCTHPFVERAAMDAFE